MLRLRWLLTLSTALSCLAIIGCDAGPPLETAEERSAAIEEAFGESAEAERPAEIDERRRREIESFMQKLGSTFKSGDATRCLALFSTEDLVDCIDEQDLCTLPRGVERRAMIEGLEQGIGGRFATDGPAMGWNSVEVRKIDPIAANRWVVYGRFYDADLDVFTKDRWWLIRQNGKIQFYDWESFDLSIRTSTMVGLTMAAALEGAVWIPTALEVVQGFTIFTQLGEAFDTSSLEANARALIAHDDVPDDLAFFGHLALHTSGLFNGELGTDREHIDAMLRLKPDSGLAHQSLGNHLQANEKYAPAIASFEKSAELLGWDVDLHESVSDCYLQLGERDKALDHARKGLDIHGESLGCLASLAVSLPDEEKAQILPRIAALASSEDGYVTVIDHAWSLEDGSCVCAVLPEFRAKHPDSWYLEENGDELDLYCADH